MRRQGSTGSSLGPQALQLIRDSGELARDIDREARRARVEAASVRPAPGTSDALGRPLTAHTAARITGSGKLETTEVYDLVALAPVHLIRKGEW